MATQDQIFKKAIALLSGNYDKTPTAARESIYLALAKQWGSENFYRACVAHINDSDDGRFMPNAANLVKHLEKNKPNLQIEQKPSLGFCDNCRDLVAKYGGEQAKKQLKELGSALA